MCPAWVIGAPRRPFPRKSRRCGSGPRVQELFELVQAEFAVGVVMKSLLSSGLVLSGGSAQLQGICETG